ncbi:MAG: DUF1501 domain-containing protein [Alphaproteobacteria bacterium]
MPSKWRRSAPSRPTGFEAAVALWANAGTTAGKLLNAANGPDVMMLELIGWDTHSMQGGATGNLASTFTALDDTIGNLKTQLGAAWTDTVVVAATEFGRTVKISGTLGTDHGVGTVAFVLGGAVKGGRVVADWPGLAQANLFEGRDLKPTTDIRGVFKGVLRDLGAFRRVPSRPACSRTAPACRRLRA